MSRLCEVLCHHIEAQKNEQESVVYAGGITYIFDFTPRSLLLNELYVYV